MKLYLFFKLPGLQKYQTFWSFLCHIYIKTLNKENRKTAFPSTRSTQFNKPRFQEAENRWAVAKAKGLSSASNFNNKRRLLFLEQECRLCGSAMRK